MSKILRVAGLEYDYTDLVNLSLENTFKSAVELLWNVGIPFMSGYYASQSSGLIMSLFIIIGISFPSLFYLKLGRTYRVVKHEN